MKQLLHINAHQPYLFSEGKLNRSLTVIAISALKEKGYEIRTTSSADSYEKEYLEGVFKLTFKLKSKNQVRNMSN